MITANEIEDTLNSINGIEEKVFLLNMNDRMDNSYYEERDKINNEIDIIQNKINDIDFISELISSKKMKDDLENAKTLISKANNKRYYVPASALFIATYSQLNSMKNRIKPDFNSYTCNELIELLEQEILELKTELRSGGSNKRILEEAGDVGACLSGILSVYLK